ncbi:MAG: TerB family tellurite resistance protein [Candidatus Krumholzibacteriia bacterium]
MLERFLKKDAERGLDLPGAVCALLVAAARADGEFSAGEARTLAGMVAARFALSPEATARLVTDVAAEEHLDLYPVTRWLMDNADRDQRAEVVRLMWSVVFSDGRLEDREDQLMHRVGKLLGLSHQDLIALKLAARP